MAPEDGPGHPRPLAERPFLEPPRTVLTLLGPRVERGHFECARDVLARFGLRVERVAALSGRWPEDAAATEPARTKSPPCRVLGLFVSGPRPGLGALGRAVRSALAGSEIDAVAQRDDGWRRCRRLVCLDMDSTLIDAEVIDELARAAGAEREVAAITDAAMRGEVEFSGALRSRLARIAGLSVESLEGIARNLSLSPGADRMLGALDRHGYRIAVVSGGFAWFARRVAERFGFRVDHIHAHELVIRGGRLTGEIEGDVIDSAAKAAFVRRIAAHEGIAHEQIVAVGDGANDAEMLSAAGLGVAFRPRPVLAEAADHVLEHFGLDGILYLLGMNDRDID